MLHYLCSIKLYSNFNKEKLVLVSDMFSFLSKNIHELIAYNKTLYKVVIGLIEKLCNEVFENIKKEKKYVKNNCDLLSSMKIFCEILIIEIQKLPKHWQKGQYSEELERILFLKNTIENFLTNESLLEIAKI